MRVPIYVISGFLGAGKTTLINNLLESAPDSARIMVLVNEFGRISIDKKTIRADPSHIVDLSGGCICCGMVTELIASLRFALDELKADAILIESTGLAVPQGIAEQALSPVFEGRIESGGIITVVDAGSVFTEDYPFIEAQIKEADIVVLNKIDLIDSNTLGKVRDRIETVVPPECSLFETRFGRISYNDILTRRCGRSPVTPPETRPEGVDGPATAPDPAFQRRDKGVHRVAPGQAPGSGPERRGADSTAGFAAVCLVRGSPVDVDEMIAFYRRHRDKIVRAKGFVMTGKGGEEVQVSKSGIEVKKVRKPIQETELVLIVREGDKEFIESELRKLLD